MSDAGDTAISNINNECRRDCAGGDRICKVKLEE